jgi:hypothetical protein
LKKTNYRLIQILKYFLESMSLQFQKHLIEWRTLNTSDLSIH